MRTRSILILSSLLVAMAFSCKKKSLPILGPVEYVEVFTPDGPKMDSVPHTVDAFSFLNQDSVLVTQNLFAGKIYVADFFFTSCPTICPLMKKQMERIYGEYDKEDRVLLLSHTIDPSFDTVDVLRKFARGLGVKSSKWHFVTGKKRDIYSLALNSYMVAVSEDENAQGGLVHSGALLLVDGQRRIRGVYEGTDPGEVSSLIRDIRILLSNTPPG